LVAQGGLDSIDAADLMEDPSSDARVIIAGVEKFSPNVGEAGDGDYSQVGMAGDEGLIGAQAVALQVALERGVSLFADEDGVEAGVGAAFVPVEKDAVLEVVINPELAEGGFAFAGVQATDGGFVDFDVVGLPEAGGEKLIEGQQSLGKVVVPGAHEVAGEFDAVGGAQFPFLPIEGAVITEFLGEEVGSERGCQDAAGEQAGFERRSEGNGIDFVFTDVGEALDDLKGEGGGADVEALAGFLTEQAEVVGGGEDFGMDDLAGDGRQAFEGGTEFSNAAGAGLGREDFSRRWNVGPNDGVGLFCLVLEELQEELVMTHLLALGSVNALEQCGDDAFLDGELGLKVGDLGGKFFDLLFRRCDVDSYSMWCTGPGVICSIS